MLSWRVYSEAQRRVVFLRPIGNVVYVTPSFNIPDQDLSELLAVVRESVASATEG
jgi:adenosylmethionine-8-amino-7-oxononanoate aminotransferase